jgi:hypothetical protein
MKPREAKDLPLTGIKKTWKFICGFAIKDYFCNTKMVIVAQQVRALVCGTRGRGFESRLSPLKAFYKYCERLFFITLFVALPPYLCLCPSFLLNCRKFFNPIFDQTTQFTSKTAEKV